MDDYCIYPVINGSTFFIDDFPSPVPSGEAQYITRDYNLTIKDFYTQVWWNDIYNLAVRHGIKYTGLVIELYSDQISGVFPRNDDLERYHYFGNMLLSDGGEIGFHGYNHMPLVLQNWNYRGLYDTYKQWNSYEEMHDAFAELQDFCRSLYPEEDFQVYVPPSNILSPEGREMLAKDFPGIKSIASVYLPGDIAFDQEFNVSDDGMVNTPRIISGYVLDDYVYFAELSELNFHFVNTHFQHPDDVLDEDRGAELGWQEMFSRLEKLTDWLYSSAPDIRNLTGSELAAAVQRYDFIKLNRQEKEDTIILDLENFKDEAWFFLRLNEGSKPGGITNGEITKVADGLYLVKANADHVEIGVTK